MNTKATKNINTIDLSKVYSNGKTILEMTEAEYMDTEEGSLDVFAEEYSKAHKPVKAPLKIKTTTTPKFDEKKLEKASIEKRVERSLKSKTDRSGFKCLGYKDGNNYIWSNLRQCMFVLNQKDLNKNNFLNMFGLKFMQDNYQSYNDKGIPSGFNLTELSGDIIDGCVEVGVFNDRNIYGYGIFVDPTDKDHLIINGSDIWGTNPNYKGERIIGKHVFANIKDLDFPKDTPVATKEEMQEWFDLLGTWNYKRGRQDQLLSFGWSIIAPFAGCLNWRTHYSETGEQGTGKSTKQICMGNFMGEFALNADGQSSEAGIRQKMGSSAGVVIIDEAEADGKKIANTLTFFRTASSSGNILKGTSDQSGMDFILKITGMIGGIVPPALNPADLSRFLRIELLPKGEAVHPLLIDVERQGEIGKKTIMYIIQNYKMFKSVCKKVRKLLLEDNNVSRYADSFTTIIAGAYIGLHLNDDDVGIKEFMKEFNFDKEKTQMATKDHDNLLNKILKTVFRAETGSYSVIEMINGLFHGDNDADVKKDIKRALGRNGIKVENEDDHYKVYLGTKDENFVKILRNSKFDAGDVTSVLSRVNGSKLISDSVMIGGTRQPRSTVVLIELPKKDYTFKEEDK